MYEKISNDDLHQLFDNCLLRYNGIPVFVQAKENGTVYITSVGGNEYEAKAVKISDKNFDYTPVPLGYANVDGYAYHLSRNPSRQFVVGLTARNMVVKSVNAQQSDKSIRAIQAFKTKGLRDCIYGVYPALGEAMDMLQEKKASTVGVDRSFAIDRDHCLYFKEERVGIMGRDNDPIFFNTKNYLRVLWERGYARTRT